MEFNRFLFVYGNDVTKPGYSVLPQAGSGLGVSANCDVVYGDTRIMVLF